MEMFDVRIRDARPSDAPELSALMCELGYDTTRSEMEARARTIIGNDAYATFVAEADGKAVGMISTFSFPTYEHNDLSGKILALVVSSKERGSGIGRALIAAAEKDFAKRGVKRIALTTRLTRKKAHLFYESLGYERNGWRYVKEAPGSSRYAEAK